MMNRAELERHFLEGIPDDLLERMKHTTLQKFLKAEIEMIDYYEDVRYVEDIFSSETIELAGGIDNLAVPRKDWSQTE